MKIHQILISDTNKLPKELPPYAQMCVKSITDFYGTEEYHLYSGEEIEEIIKFNFDNNVYKSYQKLKPYAYKSDLARYCLLYLYGGLYIDLNTKFFKSMGLFCI
jgi:mannosyltransferase OCH1-like enzyme